MTHASHCHMSRHAHRALQLVALGTTAFIASCSDGTAEPAAVPSTLTVEPSSLVLKVNRTQQLTANVRDQRGQTMSSLPGNVELRWSSSDTTRLVVDAITGLARAVRPGASTINATAGAAAGTLSVSILSSIPNSVQINGGATNLRIAETRALVATVFDDEGVAVNPDREGLTVSWSTSDASVVAVTTSGAIRALRPGNATITAQAGSAQASVDFVVLEPQVNLEIATQVSMRVGSAGGVLTTTATNGRKFTLTIPPGSLRDTTELTLVPIASIDNLPVGSTLLGAAHFLPEGLQLNGPATLRITGVPQTNASNATGFTYEGTGAALQRTVLGMRSDTAVVLLTHFSGAGALNVQDASSVPAPGRSQRRHTVLPAAGSP